MNSFIFLRNKFRWLLLFARTISKKPFRSKIKIIYVNDSLHVYVCEDKKNYSGKCFHPVRYRDYEYLSNQETLLKYNKVINTYSIDFTPISEPAGRRNVASQQTFVLIKTSWRRLEDAFRLRLQKTSWRHLEDVLVKINIFVLAIRLQDVFKTSSRRLAKTSSRHLQDVFKTFSRRLQDVFKTSSRRIIKLNCSS